MSRRKHQFRDPNAQAKATAQIVNQRYTCEGCAFLQVWPRPQCKGEASPHFRMVRDTYHERCAAFGVRGRQDAEPVKAEPLPVSRAEIAGEVAKRKHNRWGRKTSDPEHAAMMERNAARKVRA